jgi:D-alanyl-lipoteichoic acid acyltransferase DltB (MBOAT superfamily)
MYGEKVAGYPVGMVNEREIRAGAGILFFIGIITFMIAITTHNFEPAKFMIIGFLIDFIVRIINPKYAPSLIVGRIIVSGQTVEYVGAKQKRFAWVIGVILALIMLYTMVINDVRGPINFIICGLCLLLLFIESAFGICLGCKVYNIFDKEQAQYCAGGVCEVRAKEEIQKVNLWQIFSVLVLVVILFITPYLLNFLQDNVEKDCTVPQFAIDIEHEEMWKKHNNCE